jgi:hypothetical protein
LQEFVLRLKSPRPLSHAKVSAHAERSTIEPFFLGGTAAVVKGEQRMDLRNLKTPRQIVESCPALTMGGLRMLLFHSQTNGLEACVVRLGRKLVIDEAAFVEWLERRRAAAELKR